MVLSSRELCLASASLLVAVIQLAAQSPPAEFKQAGTEQVGTRHVRAWVTGRVVVEGYKVPPQSVAVSMNCGGLPRTQAYTESDGHFGFEPTFAPSLSASSPVGADSERTAAEIQGVQGIESSVASQWNCRLSANLAGYTSSQLDVGLLGPDGATLLSYSDQASVGDIVLRRLESLTGHAVSSTMADAPDVAVAVYEQGMLGQRQLFLPPTTIRIAGLASAAGGRLGSPKGDRCRPRMVAERGGGSRGRGDSPSPLSKRGSRSG